MNEYIDITLRRNGLPLRIARQVPGGVELDEPEAVPRPVCITFDAADDITRYRLRRIRQIKGWDPGQFKLAVSVEDGSMVLRGVDAYSLPEGRYTIGVTIAGTKTRASSRRVTVDHDGFGAVTVEVRADARTVCPDLATCDPIIQGVLDRSTIDDAPAATWIADGVGSARKACLFNVLATLRVRPTPAANLARHVRSVFWLLEDRAYASVDRALFDELQQFSIDDRKPFYCEGPPTARIHMRLLDRIPEPPERKALFPPERLVSYRAEGRPSLQVVIVQPPPGCDYTYADIDLDLGNPLQDVEGFVVHMGELARNETTNHVDMRPLLAKGPAKAFLYYTVA